MENDSIRCKLRCELSNEAVRYLKRVQLCGRLAFTLMITIVSMILVAFVIRAINSVDETYMTAILSSVMFIVEIVSALMMRGLYNNFVFRMSADVNTTASTLYRVNRKFKEVGLMEIDKEIKLFQIKETITRFRAESVESGYNAIAYSENGVRLVKESEQ